MPATITVLDSLGATQTVNTLPALGKVADAASFPVALSTEASGKLDQLHTDLIAATPAGSNIIGKVGIDQTTPGTTNGVVVNTLPSQGFGGSAVSIVRPANVTAYSAIDVVGGAIDLGVMGPSAGRIMLTTAQLELDIAAIPGTPTMGAFRLYLYSVTPPSALADNAAWDLPSGDRASFLGYIDLGTPVDLGSTCYTEFSGYNKQVLLTGTHLFGYLVTTTGYTPANNSETYKLTVHSVSV